MRKSPCAVNFENLRLFKILFGEFRRFGPHGINEFSGYLEGWGKDALVVKRIRVDSDESLI